MNHSLYFTVLFLSPQLHLTAPSHLSVTPTQPHLHPLTPTPFRLCPLPRLSHHLPVALHLPSSTTEARHLLLNSNSTPLYPLPLNSSSPLLHRLLPLSNPFPPPPTRVLCLHPAKLPLPKSPNHSSPSLRPSPPSPQRLHLSVSLPSCLARLPLPRAPSHPEHPHLPLSQGHFLLLVLLQPHFPLASTQAPCHPSSSPLLPSHPPTTQVPLLPALRCLPLPWPRAITCLQDHRAHQALLGPCSSIHLSLACREDSLLSRMVRSRPRS